eukprot:COSAG06_NODE_43543_length_371_cov_0.709559_1_plen_20_part_01
MAPAAFRSGHASTWQLAAVA